VALQRFVRDNATLNINVYNNSSPLCSRTFRWVSFVQLTSFSLVSLRPEASGSRRSPLLQLPEPSVDSRCTRKFVHCQLAGQLVS